ncbi:hypothetical protein MPTK1_5g00850 [Marchantia polymorpha subsp. ruderalis]|uniref:Uncharacterized protein n=2 Tax=Marchantia polymorpha TaxID=3197 RepID=A0AAF6BDK3_MARPO|nr:hypothetical protein MARPO_0193s0012 [Marchantia polymorpha]BBN10087.1 hypothetical protein Mp_5g00850 [Marchantia polymorpha subsp. ruderalis]|eukprot:PTQ27547.1 hypothetical protein MARPO_0193s0012 [Marchantia polymorpha]
MADMKLAAVLVTTTSLLVHIRDPDLTSDFAVSPGTNASALREISETQLLLTAPSHPRPSPP